MPKSRLPAQGPSKPRRTSDTGTGTGAPSRQPRGNAYANQKLGKGGGGTASDGPDVAAAVDYGDAGYWVESGQGQGELFAAPGRLAATFTRLEQVHAAQARGDTQPFRAVPTDPIALGEELFLYHPADVAYEGLEGVLHDALEKNPALATDLRFTMLLKHAEAIAAAMPGWRRDAGKALAPHAAGGMAVGPFPLPAAGQLRFDEYVLKVVEQFTPLLDAADLVRILAAGASSAKGDAAVAQAKIIAAQLTTFGAFTQEFKYLEAIFDTSKASPDVRRWVAILTGRESLSDYAMDPWGLVSDARLEAIAGGGGGGPKWTDTQAGAPAPAGPGRPGATSTAGTGPAVKAASGDVTIAGRDGDVKVSASTGKGSVGTGLEVKSAEGDARTTASAGGDITFGEKVTGSAKVGAQHKEGDDTYGASQSVSRREDGRIVHGSEVSRTSTDEIGRERTDTVSMTAGDQVYGASATRDTKTKDARGEETTKSNTVSGTWDGKDNKLEGGWSTATKDHDGEVTSSKSVSGSAQHTDTTTAASVEGTLTSGKKSVSLGGEASLELTEPARLRDGRWQIVVSFKMGVKGSYGQKGKSTSGSVGGSVRTLSTRTRLFDTEAAAKAFFENPDRDVSVTSAADALRMREGESATQEVGLGGSLGGSMKAGPASVSVGASAELTDYSTVTRAAGDRVRVEVGDKVLASVSGGISAYGIGGGLGKSRQTSESRTVEFDLSNPMGRRAFENLQKHGQLPLVRNGWTLVGESESQADTTHRSLSILGIAMGSSSTTGSSVSTLDGKRTETDWGAYGSSVSIPLGGDYSRKHGLTGFQVNEGANLYQTESVVQGSNLGDVKKGLAKSVYGRAGDHGGSEKGSNKGTYRIQAGFGEKQIDDVIEAVTGPDARQRVGMNSHTIHAFDGLERIQGLLKRAGRDRDAQRRALADWVSREGQYALDIIHTLGGGAHLHGVTSLGAQFHAAVDGDPYLTGLQGQLDLELRIARWDQRLVEGERGPALTSTIRKDLDFQRKKLRHLETCGELPSHVFQQEYQRTKDNIGLLDALSLRSLERGQSAPPDGALDASLAKLRAAMARTAETRGQMQESYEHAWHQRRLHVDGKSSSRGLKAASAFKDLQDEYAHCDRKWSEGESARKLAEKAESMTAGDLGKADLAGMTALATKASAEYRRAWSRYESAFRTYLNLQRAIEEAGMGAFFEFANHREFQVMKPGQ